MYRVVGGDSKTDENEARVKWGELSNNQSSIQGCTKSGVKRHVGRMTTTCQQVNYRSAGREGFHYIGLFIYSTGRSLIISQQKL